MCWKQSLPHLCSIKLRLQYLYLQNVLQLLFSVQSQFSPTDFPKSLYRCSEQPTSCKLQNPSLLSQPF